MKAGIQIITNIIIFLVSILALSSVIAMDQSSARTHDGLTLVKDSNFDLAYLLPDADLGKYNKIILLEADITFKKTGSETRTRPGALIQSRIRTWNALSVRAKNRLSKSLPTSWRKGVIR